MTVLSIEAALLLFWLSLTRTAASDHNSIEHPHRTFVMMNGGSSFFYPIEQG
jgi:hypothetical protein